MQDKDRIWTLKTLAEHAHLNWVDVRGIVERAGIPAYLVMGSRKFYDHRALAAVMQEKAYRKTPEYKEQIRQKKAIALVAARATRMDNIKQKRERMSAQETAPQVQDADRLARIEDKLDKLDKLLRLWEQG